MKVCVALNVTVVQYLESCLRETERETERQRERQTDRQTERARETERALIEERDRFGRTKEARMLSHC
jgi:hypothetical protein